MSRHTIINRGIAGVVALGLGATTALLFTTKRDPDPDLNRQTTVGNSELPRLGSTRLDRSDAEDPRFYKGMPGFDQKVSVEHFFAWRSGFRDVFDGSSCDLKSDISKHFGLEPHESQLVGSELKQLYEDLRIIESKHARIVENKKGEEEIEISPSPEIRSRTDAFIEKLAGDLADPAKGRELAQLIVTNPSLAAGNFTQRLSIEERRGGSDGIRTACLKRLLYDEYGSLADAVWIGLKGSPSVERAYKPIFSAADRQRD